LQNEWENGFNRDKATGRFNRLTGIGDYRDIIKAVTMH